jgi:hypothetical protein
VADLQIGVSADLGAFRRYSLPTIHHSLMAKKKMQPQPTSPGLTN